MVRQMPSVSEPDDKMLDRSNFKVIADDKFRAAAPPPQKKKKERKMLVTTMFYYFHDNVSMDFYILICLTLSLTTKL